MFQFVLSSLRMRLSFSLLLFVFSCSAIRSNGYSSNENTIKYIMGQTGESCYIACSRNGLNCNPGIIPSYQTESALSIMRSLLGEKSCETASDSAQWMNTYQPAYLPSENLCVGYSEVPLGVLCGGRNASVERLCRCDRPSNENFLTFGSVVSSGLLSQEEQDIFMWVLEEGKTDIGVLTEFYITYPPEADNGTVISYYIDGEETASISYIPSLAAGTGSFSDEGAPWGNSLIGKGSQGGGAWFNFIKVPFRRSIRITAKNKFSVYLFYAVTHGALNQPLPYQLPLAQTKLQLHKLEQQLFQPLQYVPLVTIQRGLKGAHFMLSVSAKSGNLNFLEGCVHMYTAGIDFPGILLSSGTEEWNLASWYFDIPVPSTQTKTWRLSDAGFTSYRNYTDSNGGSELELSFYRIQREDPLRFSDGFQLEWRIGNVVDRSGHKCFAKKGTIIGQPMPTTVTSYAWTYVIDES